jgi:hypothetical protein
MKTDKPKAGSKRKKARPLLLAVASATTLYVACGDDSTSGNLMAVDYDLSATADMAKPDLASKD